MKVKDLIVFLQKLGPEDEIVLEQSVINMVPTEVVLVIGSDSIIIPGGQPDA
jgi:hypothetical protein